MTDPITRLNAAPEAATPESVSLARMTWSTALHRAICYERP